MNDPTKGSIYSDEFLVMEREVSKLRRECVRLASELQAVVPLLREAEAKLVERDVYEAQQILPPEQATLIKHLATVERCIEHGRLKGYDLEDRWCVFCEEYMDDHTKDCAWLALQFDRKPAETMAMVEGWAWDEDARRDRERARAMTPQRPGRNTMTGLSEWLKNTWAIERVQDVTPGGAGLRGHISVIENALVPPGTAYLLQTQRVGPADVEFAPNPLSFETRSSPDYADLERRVLRQMSPEQRESLFPKQTEYLGEWPDEYEAPAPVADSDDDKVP